MEFVKDLGTIMLLLTMMLALIVGICELLHRMATCIIKSKYRYTLDNIEKGNKQENIKKLDRITELMKKWKCK